MGQSSSWVSKEEARGVKDVERAIVCGFIRRITSEAETAVIPHVRAKSLQLRLLWTTLLRTWRRKWQPTPVLLPGESHGQKSLVGYSPWGHRETDTH